jgi:hypothetical protein
LNNNEILFKISLDLIKNINKKNISYLIKKNNENIIEYKELYFISKDGMEFKLCDSLLESNIIGIYKI